jgi:non-heme chloroperoxidase
LGSLRTSPKLIPGEEVTPRFWHRLIRFRHFIDGSLDGLQAQLAANRSQFYRDLPEGPFYGFNRPGVKASEAIIQNWWRQGMMGGAKAHYDGIVAFSQTDFTDDLKKITVPVLVMHGDDDQIVPYADAGPLSAKLLKNGTLKTYKGFPHGMPTTQADTINADLLERDEI